MDSGPQTPSAVSHSASRVAGTNCAQVPVVSAAPPLLPSPSQTALLSLLPSGLISSRTRHRRATAGGKPQAAVDCGFDRSVPTPSAVPRPAPTEGKPRPPRSASPSHVAPGPFIDPVPAVPTQHATGAATPDLPYLGFLSPEASRRVRTPAALPETPSPAEIELIESVELCSHTDWTREQRTDTVCDAIIRYLLLVIPSVLPDDFFLIWRLTKAPRCRNCALLPIKGASAQTTSASFCSCGS